MRAGFFLICFATGIFAVAFFVRNKDEKSPGLNFKAFFAGLFILLVLISFNSSLNLAEIQNLSKIPEILQLSKKMPNGITIYSPLHGEQNWDSPILSVVGFDDNLMISTNENGQPTMIWSRKEIRSSSF
jgi:hypothetical protein